MTIYLALDAIADGAPLPSGRIVGIAETTAGLVAQGFRSGTYRGNRRRSIDETDSSVWDNDCTVGWYYHNGSVQFDVPLTAAQTLRQLYRTLNEEASRLSIKLANRAAEGWHAPGLVAKGNAWIYHAAHEAAYMVALNSTHSATVKTRFATTGIGILRAILAEQDSETLYNGVEPIDAPTGPVLVVNLSTGAQIPFASAVEITPSSGGYPAAPASADLGGGSWVERIT